MNILGTTYDVQPMAPDEDHTTWLDAGALRVGIEYRELDPTKLGDYYTGDDKAEIDANSPDGGFTDKGVSLHVVSVADDHEYLRFDMFEDEPHYHYVDKTAGTNTLIGFDQAANGEMVDWVLANLGERLAPMLAAAGAGDLAAGLDPDAGDGLVDVIRNHLTSIGVLEETT